MFSTFRDFLKSQLRAFNLSPSILRLEIAEDSYGKHIAPLSNVMDLMQEQDGIVFALDNFGALNSSLSYLDQSSFKIIKIDKAITHKMNGRGELEKNSLMLGIVSLGKVLGKKVLIEGVETPAQARRLWEMGVDYCQGWYFGRAISAEDLKKELIVTP